MGGLVVCDLRCTRHLWGWEWASSDRFLLFLALTSITCRLHANSLSSTCMLRALIAMVLSNLPNWSSITIFKNHFIALTENREHC